MQGNVLSGVDEWEVLSVSDSGEAVIGYHESDRFAVVKASTVRGAGLTVDDLFSAFEAAMLEENVQSFEVRFSQVTVNGEVWIRKLYRLYDQFVIVQSCLHEDYFYVIKATLMTADDVIWFDNEQSKLLAAMDFTELHRNAGRLCACGHSIEALGISEVALSTQGSGDSLLFVSNNKYFAVTVSENSQRDVLLAAVSDREFTREVCEASSDDVLIERFYLHDKDKVTGTVELYSISQDDCFVEVLGYWRGYANSSVKDNILLSFEQEEDIA